MNDCKIPSVTDLETLRVRLAAEAERLGCHAAAQYFRERGDDFRAAAQMAVEELPERSPFLYAMQ